MAKRKKKTSARKDGRSAQIASPGQVERIKGQLDAVQLRLMGWTYENIGRRLGITRQAAHARVKKALQEWIAELDESTEELRQLELARLDKAQLSLWPSVLRGDTTAINTLLRVMKRRAALTGIDVPLEIDWRREAEEQGLEPSELFEQMVNVFAERMEGEDEAS